MQKANITNKEIAEVKLGDFSVTLDEEKLGLLYSLGCPDGIEIRQIQEITDMLLDSCCGCVPSEEDCLKCMKYLKNLRGAFEYLQGLEVKKGGDSWRK